MDEFCVGSGDMRVGGGCGFFVVGGVGEVYGEGWCGGS